MPEPLQILQKQLLKHSGGDRLMAEVLSAIPLHGLDTVLVAVECALEVGHTSGEHILNILGRLKETAPPMLIETHLVLKEEPVANVNRYERLRSIQLENHDVS